MREPFAPAVPAWTPVSVRLRDMRRLLLVVLAGGPSLVGAAALVWASAPWIALAVLVGAAVAVAWGWRVVDRGWRALQYAERTDDLAIRRGVFVRTLVLVPYGRMQFVDIEAGPLRRRFGIATVQLHTAAAATDATIPGLLDTDAAALRDRLAVRSRERSAGL
jgi:uncharacterized protein